MSNKYYERNLVVGPFQCNCRIFVCPETYEAMIVDPGEEGPRILKALTEIEAKLGHDIKVKYLFQTHGHLDHVSASKSVKEGLAARGQAPQIALHAGDEPLYQMLKEQGKRFRLNYEDPLPLDLKLEHEMPLDVGRLKFGVIHTPGHSPGSVCLRMSQDNDLGTAETLLTGDTLFQGSVGRTDLWGASQDQMFEMIRNRILTLGDDIRVSPGHGPDSKIGIERRTNPFLV